MDKLFFNTQLGYHQICSDLATIDWIFEFPIQSHIVIIMKMAQKISMTARNVAIAKSINSKGTVRDLLVEWTTALSLGSITTS